MTAPTPSALPRPSSLFRYRTLSGRRRPSLDLLISAALFAASFAIYARTVTPGVLDADGGEFQTNIYRLGVSHTGYPLYFLLAKFWTLVVPFGTVAWRANLFSCLMGAAAVALLYAALRLVTGSRTAALPAAALFAVSRVEWSQALIPDVYTLNSFFIILVLFVAALYRMGRVSPAWLAFVYGLSLTHHRTMLWFAPALGVWLVLTEGRSLFRPGRLLQLAIAFLLPLTLYAYIPLRGESDVGVEYHAAGFAEMILAGNVSISLRFGPPGFLWSRIAGVYLPLLAEQFTPVGFLVGLVGTAALALGRAPRGGPAALPPRQWLLLLALAHLAETAFAVVFWVVDSEIFFIPSYLTFLFLVAAGLACVEDFVGQATARPLVRRVAPGLLMAAAAALALWLGLSNFQRVDRSWDDEADARWQAILAQPLERGAWLVGNWEDLTPLEYYQYVEGRRPDLRRLKVTIYRDQLKLAPQGDIGAWIEERLNARQAVYLTRHPADTETLGAVAQRLQLAPVASLWRAQQPTPGLSREFFTALQPGLALAVVETPPSYRAGDLLTPTFGWLLDEGRAGEYEFSLRLIDRAANVWAEQSGPVIGGKSSARLASDSPRVQSWTRVAAYRPFQGMQPWLETAGLFIPPDAPPGDYALQLHARAVGSEERPDSRWTELASIQVRAAPAALPRSVYAIPHPLDQALGGARLLGYALSAEPLHPGDRVELQAWWQGINDGSAPLELAIVDSRGADLTLSRGALAPAIAAGWDPRQIIRSRHTFVVPPSAPPGPASLSLRLDGARVDLPLKLLPGNRLFAPPTVQYSQRAALGGAIELIGYNLERLPPRPGENLQVTLYWHSAQPVQSSYKVFVHLLGPTGALAAQRDDWPRGGALPTDRWLPGEYVTDEYQIELPPDLAAGEYRVEVGMYSPDGGERVAAVDAAGARLPDDRILLNAVVHVSR